MQKMVRARLEKIVDGFSGSRVLIIGDLVADVYLRGRIDRISREAPVLILIHEESVLKPGGAANSTANIRSLGGEALPVGIVGEDGPGGKLLSLFEGAGIRTEGILRDRAFPTAVKTRILAGAPHSDMQQVLRIDTLSRFRHRRETIARSLSFIRTQLKSSPALLISDYGLGFVCPELVNPAIETARSMKRIVTLDSRHNLLSYLGVSAATPNQPEVEEIAGRALAVGDGSLERTGRAVLKKLKSEALLITRGSSGMSLFEKGRKTAHIPVFGSKERVDVTGAGDTVISTFTLALSAGASFFEAATIANYAGGLKVMKHGSATITREELLEAIRANHT